MPRREVVITGVGAVSALGRGFDALAASLFEGREAIAPITRFDVSAFGRRGVAALVRDAHGDARWIDFAIEAAKEALAMARVDAAATRVALVMGTSLGHGNALTDGTSAVAAALGLRGPRVTFSTACTSSANAIGYARDLVASGDADIALAGGADEVTLGLFAGFDGLKVIAEGPCAPFGPVFGTTLGEGAGFVVLEREGARDVSALGLLAGYGLSSDAYHETSPDPRGMGVCRAVRAALGDARWTPDAVDYVNAHATGTASNDEAEWLGIEAALGARAKAVPVSASKGSIGHAQGAAGVLELLVTMACVARGCVPSSPRAEAGRRRGPPDTVAGPLPRTHPVTRYLSLSSAFGGANVALAIGPSARPEPARRAVSILSGGVALGDEEIARARSGEGLRAVAPSVDPRSLDPLARLAVCACGAALRGIGGAPAGDLRDRAGIILAAPRVSPESARAWQDAIDKRGYTRVNAAAFARLVLHATTGTVSKAFSLRGPASTLAGSSTAGLAAVAYAASMLATRDDADVMLAGAAVEDEHAEPSREGAAIVCLGAGVTEGRPVIAGVAIEGAGRVEAAIARAASRGRDGARWTVIDGAGATRATAAVEALLDAARAITEGRARVAGVAAHDEQLSCAILLEGCCDER